MDPVKYAAELQLAREAAVRDAFARGESSLQRFYSGRTAFVTGGTGFLGKSLIEKLLRALKLEKVLGYETKHLMSYTMTTAVSCVTSPAGLNGRPALVACNWHNAELRTCKVSKIFVLMRTKKGKNVEARLQELLDDTVFEYLREHEPNFGEKLVPVAGDMSDIRLGINDEDWDTLTNEVEVIFHEAATTRFDEALKLATLINVRGARECLKLGKACKKLVAYVHVSTAFTHCTNKNFGDKVEETFYHSPIPPDVLISMAEGMEEDRLTAITADLIKDWPNTYTFTKALSEELIRTTSDGLPICVIRPAIVISAMSEPSPGWMDPSAMFSASGLVTLILLGVKKLVLVDQTKRLALVPCDYVTNTALAAGREAAVTQTRGGNDTKIYVVSSACRNPMNWREAAVVFRSNRYVLAPPSALYYNETTEIKSKSLFTILTILMQMIPANIADFVCLLIGKKRQFVRLAKKEFSMSSALSYFMLNDWTMLDHNTNKLYDSLSEQDKVIFNFDVTDIKWSEYMIIWMIGIRKYLVKDGLKDTDWGVRKQKIFFYVHYCLFLPLYMYLLWKAFYLCTKILFGLGTRMFY